jgi:hypothetical protein
MQGEKTVSIKFAPNLLTEAEAIASQHGTTVDQWIVSVVSNHVARENAWKMLLERTRSLGREMGIESEADVERVLGEFRTEKHA